MDALNIIFSDSIISIEENKHLNMVFLKVKTSELKKSIDPNNEIHYIFKSFHDKYVSIEFI